MRKVTCRITGEVGNNYEFYKAVNGKYYKDEEIYKKSLISNDYRKKIFILINSKILNKRTNNCGSLIGKLINETGLETKVIYDSIYEKLDYIKDLFKNSNESDTSKIYAIFAIATKKHTRITYAGCYEIRNNETNEVYIGESINLFYRFTTHISELYENKHHCKMLQEAFNKHGNISNFTITPLFMFPIAGIDKNELKQETLYLESAFYLIYKNNNEVLYNTKNPYIALKNASVCLKGYSIDCNYILQLMIEDKYHVIPKGIAKLIKKDLKYIGFCINETIQKEEIKSDIQNEQTTSKTIQINNSIKTKNVQEQINYTKELLKNNVNLYRITNVLNDFSNSGIIPKDYDYSKIRKILVENNLIYIDSLNHTVATDYALNNKLDFINRLSYKNNTPIYDYYISEKCKDILFDILSNYENKENLRRTL